MTADRIQILISEIGQKQVMFRLLALVQGTLWDVYQQVGSSNLLLLKSETGERIPIAVRTVRNKKESQVHLDEETFRACKFLIIYLLEANECFIVPEESLKREFQDVAGLQIYRDAWHSLHADFFEKARPPSIEETVSLPDETSSVISEAEDSLYWPELEDAVHKDEEERNAIWGQIEAELMIDELEKESENLFQQNEVQESLGEHLGQMKVLVAEWDPPVFDLVKRLAEASKKNTGWSLKTKIIQEREIDHHALMWEVNYTGMYFSGWYVVKLALDRNYQPKMFEIECGKEGYWISTPATIEDLKNALTEAYKLGKFSDLYRKETPGWVLRKEFRERE